MATRPASENPFPEVLLNEVAAPSSAPSGKVRLYAKSDGLLYSKDDAGTEAPLGGDISSHTGDTTDAHDASAISAVTSGYTNSTGDDVQEVLDDFDAAITAAAGGGGGGGVGAIDCKGWVAPSYSSTNAFAITIPAQASGTRILLAVGTRSNDVTSVTCTNVTWSEVKGWNSSTNTYLSIYVGVATGTTGTTITVNVGGTNYVFATAVFLGDALTPTTGADASFTGTASTNRRLPLSIATTPGDIVVMAYTTSDASSPITAMELSCPFFIVPDQLQDGLCGLHLVVGMAAADHVSGWYDGGNGTAIVVGLVGVS